MEKRVVEQEGEGEFEVTRLTEAEREEIEAYTFPEDGYDYSQHFADRGDGIFIQADGRIIQPEDRPVDEVKETVDIPEDVPEDILEALNGEAEDAEEEDAEELDELFAKLQHDEMEEREAEEEFQQALEEWEDDGLDGEGLEIDDEEVQAAIAELQSGQPNTPKRKDKKCTRHVAKEELTIDPKIIEQQVRRQQMEEELEQEKEKAEREREKERKTTVQSPSAKKTVKKTKNKPKVVRVPKKK